MFHTCREAGLRDDDHLVVSWIRWRLRSRGEGNTQVGGGLILGKRARSVFPHQVFLFHQTGAHLFNLRVKGNDAAFILVVLLSLVLWDVRGPLIEAIWIYCITRISDDFPVSSGISPGSSVSGARPEDDR